MVVVQVNVMVVSWRFFFLTVGLREIEQFVSVLSIYILWETEVRGSEVQSHPFFFGSSRPISAA